MRKNLTHVLLLQGGGALGAYQAGAFEALDEQNYSPDYVLGISIGAINSAIIAGNKPKDRTAKLKKFWDLVTSGAQGGAHLSALFGGFVPRAPLNLAGANSAMFLGVPGFYVPRVPPPFWQIPGTPGALSFYDTDPLRDTLLEMIDFKLLNSGNVRFAVGAVNVETGNMTWFDNATTKITPEHIMASGALPPGFPPIEIDGCYYWDGGIVSNSPLQHLMNSWDMDGDVVIFQVDLFSASGEMPANLMDSENREKEIRFSSRTRAATNEIEQRLKLISRLERMYDKLPQDMKKSHDVKELIKATSGHPDRVLLAHLIYRNAPHEMQNKDYEFSRLSKNDHWEAGKNDVEKTVELPAFQKWQDSTDLLRIVDVGNPETISVAGLRKLKEDK